MYQKEFINLLNMATLQTRFIFVTGGVVSGIGKGIVASSIGRLLKDHGLNVTIMKLDPYLNVDPGTMSPLQHGEVFVTDDGAETDLDLGHYERFTGIEMSRLNSVTSGSVFSNVLGKERNGQYNGHTVQMVPHIVDEIKSSVMACATQSNDIKVVIVEIGGTVGDIESEPFLEAARQIGAKHKCAFIHTTLIPYLNCSGELKTKPTQHSIKILRSYGIQPDFVICRADRNIPVDIRSKISQFCDVDMNCVINCPDSKSIYEVPITFSDQNLSIQLVRKLQLLFASPQVNISYWKKLVDNIHSSERVVQVGIVGKYTQLSDSYKSIYEALVHAGAELKIRPHIHLINSEDMNVRTKSMLCDALIIPGGFGGRGLNGKLTAIRYARIHNVPILGICLGMQLMVIDWARDIFGLFNADSIEFNSLTQHPVVHLMKDQVGVRIGGTMRLGSYTCKLNLDSKVQKLYGSELIYERHRHRYEFNSSYSKHIVNSGYVIAGSSLDGKLVEIIEKPDHKFFIGTQFHPEFKSQFGNPHPLFLGLLKSTGVVLIK